MNPDNRKFSDFNFADPLSAEPWVRLPDAGAIANWDEARAIARSVQNGRRMTAEPDGRVDVQAAGVRAQTLQCLDHHHRGVAWRLGGHA